MDDSKSSISRGFNRTLLAPLSSKCSTSVDKPARKQKKCQNRMKKLMLMNNETREKK